MDIGNRLRVLREAKGLSQGDIEHRTGLIRAYVSRVENGHTIPNLRTLEKWAKALELELYQLFFAGNQKPLAPPTREGSGRTSREESLIARFRALGTSDQRLVLELAGRLRRPD